MNTGHLILVVSVPGGGKSILTSHLKEVRPQLRYAVSCTSRPIRPGEKDGENYYFISEEEFKNRIERGEFLEWVQIDGGRYYGTLRSEVLEPVQRGEIVLREVEIQGARAIKELLPNDHLSIVFITPGSWEEMEIRIKQRAPIGDEELEYRRQRYEKEIQFVAEADYILENKNGKLAEAEANFVKLVDEIVSKYKSQ